MKLILCIDDKNGMLFAKRRQSRDRILTDRLLAKIDGRPLWFSPYSELLFQEKTGNFHLSDRPLEEAGTDDFCFIETEDPAPYLHRANELWLCKWNRVYPGDLHFTGDISSFHLEETEEFAGSSHEKITLEVYTK